MRARRLSVVGVLVLALTGCATYQDYPAADSYSLFIQDDAERERFELVLTSHASRAMCISVEQWPSRGGELHMGSDVASVRVNGEVIRARDENFGYCPGGCGEIIIPPKSEISGFISYSAFENQSRLTASPDKVLTFSVLPYYCRSR